MLAILHAPYALLMSSFLSGKEEKKQDGVKEEDPAGNKKEERVSKKEEVSPTFLVCKGS